MFDEMFGMAPEPSPNPTVVVNLRRDPYDVYVGRAGQGQDGYFGNPIRRGPPCPVCGEDHTSKGSTIGCFDVYARRRVEKDSVYRERVAALYGKRLGCFCKPAACHGDVLRRLTYELHEHGAVSPPEV